MFLRDSKKKQVNKRKWKFIQKKNGKKEADNQFGKIKTRVKHIA